MITSHPKPAYDHDASNVVDNVLNQLQHTPGALLPILHAVQDALGYVPEEAVPAIAKALNLSRAEVHGVISFYHYFSTEPHGENILEICRAESCQAKGGRILERIAQEHLGLNWDQTTRDNKVTLKPVYCLGNCACSPSVRVGKEVYGRVSEARLKDLMDELSSDAVTIVGGVS